MIYLSKLSNTSYKMSTDTEDIGILIDYNSAKSDECTGLVLISKGNITNFADYDAIKNIFNDDIEFKGVEEKATSTKSIGDYPVNEEDSIYDIQTDPVLGISTFTKTQRNGAKRFYVGWWIVKANEQWKPRLTLSTDIYDERHPLGEVLGPFKTYMEVTYNLKKVQE